MSATPVKRTVTITLSDEVDPDKVRINVTFDPPVMHEEHDLPQSGASSLAVKVLNCIGEALA